MAAAALLLCWPAFFNGYPLTYDDSASYLDTIDPKATIWARSVLYTAFLRPFHMHVWLWPAIYVQSLILAHLIYISARTTCGRLTPEIYLLLTLAIATTGLPWLTSMIMPYVFTGVVVLGLFLLGFARERLFRLETWYLVLLTAVAITTHMSHLGLAIALALGIMALRLYFGADRRRLAATAILAIPVAAASLAQLAVNSYARGTISFAPATSIFLLARFIADGPAKSYLQDACPDRGYVLCGYLDQLPSHSDEFLWPLDGVFRRAGGMPVLQDEAREIVIGTLRAYPGRQFAITLDHVKGQILDYRITSILSADNEAIRTPHYPIRDYIRTLFPGAYQDYLASRQHTGRLPVRSLDVLHGFVTVLGVAAGLLLTFALARRESDSIALLVVIAAALVVNAVITASVSGVFPHYQGRLAWLIPLQAMLAGLRFWCAAAERRTRQPAMPDESAATG